MPAEPRVLLEVAVASVGDARAAEAGGADRLELNAALALGGLTPSLGLLVEARAAVRAPLIGMARPRPGGFCYDADEWAVLRRDIDLLLAHGADGVAFGALTAGGEIDPARCREVVRQVGGRQAVFHRAFDVTPDPSAALEVLIDLGVRRVLTSGQQPTAARGAACLAGLVRQARGRIEILPAAGIHPDTVAQLLAETGCDQVHASLRGRRTDPSTAARPEVSFGGGRAEDGFEATDAALVRRMRTRLGL